MIPFRRIALLVCGLASLPACDRTAGSDSSAWQATRDTIGDTIVVHTTAGSVWDQPMELVEDLAIGTLEGAPEYTFGMISGLAPDDAGGIYVFDSQATALRYYDSTGTHVRTIGGDGEGPGEYREALDIALRDDGRLVLRDPRNARLVVYEPDGTPMAHIPVASGLWTSNSLVVDTAGHYWLATLTGEIEEDRPWPIGYLHVDESGAVIDTLLPPSIAGEPDNAGWSFAPQKEWILARDRSILIGVTDDYAIELRRPDGTVLRFGRNVEPVAVLPDEKAEIEALNDWYRTRQAENLTAEIPAVPDVKPIWRSLMVSDRGEIWVQRHATAERVRERDPNEDPDRPPSPTWREPGVYDVFDRDGRYLGEVRAPRRTRVVALRGDAVWGFRFGEFDEPYVVRMRLRPASVAPESVAAER